MDKKRHHNLLLMLAVVILSIGVIVQLYYIFAPERAAERTSEGTSQAR